MTQILTTFVDLNVFSKRKAYFVIAFIVISVTILEIWSSNRLSTYGDQISKLQSAKTSLMTENNLLENQIQEKSALSTIEDESVKQGFGNLKNIQYIENQGLALNK